MHFLGFWQQVFLWLYDMRLPLSAKIHSIFPDNRCTKSDQYFSNSLTCISLILHHVFLWFFNICLSVFCQKYTQSFLTIVAQKVISSSRSWEGTSGLIVVSEKDSTHFSFLSDTQAPDLYLPLSYVYSVYIIDWKVLYNCIQASILQHYCTLHCALNCTLQSVISQFLPVLHRKYVIE